MVSRSYASRWHLRRSWRRLRNIARRPSDVIVSLQLVWFIWSAPRRLDHMLLPELLQRLQSAPRPAAADLHSSRERIDRLSRPWFRLPRLRAYNTCYLRALMYYRFLDAQGQPMHIHFAVEPGRAAGDRLHGHAWITVGDEMIESPLPEVLARTRGIYSHPPRTV